MFLESRRSPKTISLERTRPLRARQRGAALAISLILLIVITLIGLAGIQAATIQQKITANFYDREIGFQSAEAAVQAVEVGLADKTISADRLCGQGGVACQANPFTDPNYTGSFHTLSGAFSAGSQATGQPQYVVENMGQFPDPSSVTGFNQTANAAQYGAQGVSGVLRTYYRVTTRSGDPAVVGDRAVVTLQAMYKQ